MAEPTGSAPASAPQGEAIYNEYLRCQGADHYAVLGIARTAARSDVVLAGQALGERLAALSAPSLPVEAQAKLVEVRGWARRALDVLGDPDKRRVYDSTLADSAGVAGPAGFRDPAAEQAYQRGRRALEAGDLELAVGELRAAAESCPDDPDYTAALGWAETRRALTDAAAGVTRLQEVCARSPRAANAHMYLGLVAEERGERDLARQALKKAVDLNPKLEKARQALDRVTVGERNLYDELFGGTWG